MSGIPHVKFFSMERVKDTGRHGYGKTYSPEQIEAAQAAHDALEALERVAPDLASYLVTQAKVDSLGVQPGLLSDAQKFDGQDAGTERWLRGEPAPDFDSLSIEELGEYSHPPLGFDHQDAWILEDGSRVARGQPYGISEDKFDELVKLRERGFRISIDGRSPWYPAHTVSVLIQSPDEQSNAGGEA